MILDEIDAGVSGEMAKAMGSFMKDISEHTQLIAITHLPQIAAMGNSHIKVYKSSDDQTTRTYVKQLEGGSSCRNCTNDRWEIKFSNCTYLR